MITGLPGASWGALRVFVAVHRAGSITGAAVDLGMAQASVSAQIQTLEKQLGYLLFERTRAGVVTTGRGRDLAALLAGPVDAMTAATRPATGDDRQFSRSVLLGGPAEFLSEVVLPGLVEELPPGVRLVVRFGLADVLIEALVTGQIDLLVSPVQPRRPGVRFEPIHDEEFVLVGHPRWLDQAHDAQDPESIDGVPVLAYDADLQVIRRYWRSVFDRPPARLRAAAVVPDLRVLARLAAHGSGMTVLPEYVARPLLERGEVVLLHEPAVAPLNTLYVATRRTATAADGVIDEVRARIVTLCRALGG